MKIKRNILLNPGPATTTNSVKLAQLVPDICPREKEFGVIINKIINDLTAFAANNKKYTTVLINGSGTAAIESILTSVVHRDRKILIVNNGSYGMRMCQIAERYKINFIEFNGSKVSPLNIHQLESILDSESNNLSHIALVHNETSTGLLNDIYKIGKLAKKYNLEVIIDAMSSFGAIPIDMKKQNISYLASSSNKNIQGLPGISFVVSKISSLEKLKNDDQLSFYLSLKEEYEYFKKFNQTRFTPPVQTLYSFKQAIKELKDETIEKRYFRYTKSWNTLINGLDDLNLSYLVDKKDHSKIITAIKIPKDVDFNELHDYMYLRGVTIYPGKIKELNTFRVANIGDINFRDIKMFLDYLKKFLETQNI